MKQFLRGSPADIAQPDLLTWSIPVFFLRMVLAGVVVLTREAREDAIDHLAEDHASSGRPLKGYARTDTITRLTMRLGSRGGGDRHDRSRPGCGGTEGGLAEADGNRTRLTEMLGHVGFRGRGGHQTP